MAEETSLYPDRLIPPPDGFHEEELRLLRRAFVVKRATLYLVALLVVICTAGGLYLGLNSNTTLHAIRATQQSNTPIGRDTHSLVTQFKDCVKPGGHCFAKAQRRTAKALERIDSNNRRASAAAAACVTAMPTDWTYHHRYRATLRCMQQVLGQ
jgi:hypothetical protein